MTKKFNRLDSANEVVQDLRFQMALKHGKKEEKELFEQFSKAKKERDTILEELLI